MEKYRVIKPEPCEDCCYRKTCENRFPVENYMKIVYNYGHIPDAINIALACRFYEPDHSLKGEK